MSTLTACEVLAVVAWDVASFLVPHQSSEDLVKRGIPAPEARQRSFFRTSLMERLSSLIHVTLILGIGVHLIIPGLVCLSLISGYLSSFVVPGTSMLVVGFWFGHIEDECNQPLGICAMIYWLQVIVKFAAVIGWRCWHGCPPDFGPPTFRRLIPCLFRIFAVVTVLFEVIFPVTTFIMLMLADSCTPLLIQQTWVVLSPFFYGAWSSWATCPNHIPIESPASLVNTFTRIRFDPDTFNDETYAKSCAICSSDFAASTASTAIVSAHVRYVAAVWIPQLVLER